MRRILRYILFFISLIVVSFLLYNCSKPIYGLYLAPRAYLKAWAMVRDGRYRKAIVLYKRIVKEYSRYPRSSEALLRMGCCYLHLGDKIKARECFQEVITRRTDLCTPISAQKCLEYLDSGRGKCIYYP